MEIARPREDANVAWMAMARIWRIIGLYFSRSEAPSEPFCSGVRPFKSWPAKNARPAPVIITQRTSGSRSLSRNASSTSLFICGTKALSACGRLSVIVATPSCFS